MRFFKPNISKLAAAKDVSGLRAALRHQDPQVRHDAARAVGMIELPPTATQRQGIVPQEAVADLLACWQEAPPQPFLEDVHKALVEAIARIDGPAGFEALVALHDEVVSKGAVRMSYSQSEGFAASVFALLGVDDLIEALDDSRPGVRKSAFSALRLKARDSRTMPADAARARDAISEYEQRKELQEQEQIARDLDRIVERAWTPDSYRDFGRIPAIRSLAKSRDPRAIEALVGIMLHGDDLSEEPRQAARDALIRIGAPAVGHLVPRLSEANPLEGVEAAYTALSKILGCERWFVDPAWEGSDLADEDLASIAALEICQGIDYHERLNPDDTYDITEFTVPVDFSPIAEHARTELTRRRSPAD